jgi:hypothetical protein
MKMEPSPEKDDDLRPEYDLSQLKGGVRGKYAQRFAHRKDLKNPAFVAACELEAVTRELSTAVDAFSTCLASNIPRPEVVQITDAEWEREEYDRHRLAVGYHKKSGVYAMFSGLGELLYIGKGMSEKLKLDRCWASDCDDRRWILAVPFDPEWDYLVPSLEVFLIRRMKPKYNSLDK